MVDVIGFIGGEAVVTTPPENMSNGLADFSYEL